VTLCNAMTETKFANATIAAVCGLGDTGSADRRSVPARIADFLDGRTNGEDLFHELYDYVLTEPIPEPMRRLLRNR
jgi:hypothetical protein